MEDNKIILSELEASVLSHFERNKKGVTTLSILRECHTTEGRKIISMLKRKGIPIQDRWEHSLDVDGKKHKFKVWFLENLADIGINEAE